MNEHLSRSERHRTVHRRQQQIKPKSSLPEKVQHALQAEVEEGELDLSQLPPRRELFPSQRLRVTRIFYNVLLYVFIGITIYLLWWGISASPWGQEHGL